MKLGPLKAHEDEVKCIDFSQDDMRLVSGSEDYKIIIWNCVLGIPIMELLEGHQAGINFVRYSFDSRVIFSVGSDNRIVSWSAESGEILNKNLSENNIYGFDVSMNGIFIKYICFLIILDEKIIYGGPNKKALIWDYRQFEGRQFCRKISFQNDILKVFWRNEADLFIVFENEIKIYFEFYRDESFFFENGLMLCQFYSNPESLTTEEFLRICNGKEGEIYPFFYNFLHVVAYTDDYNSFFEKKLSELLKKKGVKLNFEAFFELDIHGKSCYDIIIEKKNRNLIKMIFHYIAKNYTPNELMKFDFLNKITIKMMNQIIEVFGKDTSLLSIIKN